MAEIDSSESLTPEQALVQAVNRIGGQSAMARLLDVRQSTVWEWLNGPKQLPAEHVLRVEATTRVSRHDLRPDLYPRGLQDDVPFCPDSDGVAALGELATRATPEWPLSEADDGDACDRKPQLQRPAA
jgi:DNA-binding transcriptional regulator YdaS (Cro superfamily)